MSNYILVNDALGGKRLINLDLMETISISGEWIYFNGANRQYEAFVGSHIADYYEKLKAKLLQGENLEG